MTETSTRRETPRVPPIPDYKARKQHVVDSPNFMAYLKLYNKKAWIITVLICAIFTSIITEEVIYRIDRDFIAFYLSGVYLVVWYILLYLANILGFFICRTGFMLFRYLRDQAYL